MGTIYSMGYFFKINFHSITYLLSPFIHLFPSFLHLYHLFYLVFWLFLLVRNGKGKYTGYSASRGNYVVYMQGLSKKGLVLFRKISVLFKLSEKGSRLNSFHGLLCNNSPQLLGRDSRVNSLHRSLRNDLSQFWFGAYCPRQYLHFCAFTFFSKLQLNLLNQLQF